MSPPAPPVAVYDANVLYAAPLRDLLIRLALAGSVKAHWTAEIHDEWMRSLLRNRPDLTVARLERTRALMDAALPEALVHGFEDRIPHLLLPDPDDRHVLAAAIHADADAIVTWNVADFPPTAVEKYQIEVLTPDALIAKVLDHDRAPVVAAARSHRAALRNPPFTAQQYLESLYRAGLHKTATVLLDWAAEI